MNDENNTNIYKEDEKILKRIPFEILLFALIISIPCLIIFDVITSLLVVAGGFFSALSFIWLKQSLTKVILQGKKQAIKSAALLYGLRLILIIVVFFIIIFFFSKKILAFIAGFSLIVPVLLIEALVAFPMLKKWKN